MRWALIGLLILHGLIHLMGFAKAFGYAELPQLTQPISREWGVLWLLAGGLVVTTAVMLAVGARPYWIVGGVALLVSQVLIMTAWRDAWAGTAANAVLLLVVAHGLLTEGPWSFHAQYLRDVEAGRSRSSITPLVTETICPVARARAPLPARDPCGRAAPRAQLPHPVHRSHQERAGCGVDALRGGATELRGSAHASVLMRARMFGVPVQAFHRLIGGHATMQVKVAGVVPMADERGDEMDRAETVTLFNDMCILAPGTLVGPDIIWEAVDASTARARFTLRAHTITAMLFFDTTAGS